MLLSWAVRTTVVCLYATVALARPRLDSSEFYINITGLDYSKANNLSSPSFAYLESIAKKVLNDPEVYSVINNSVAPPDGDKHHWYTWAPYWWPDCSNVANVKDPQTQCPYKSRDGQYNPDLNNLTTASQFGGMVDSIVALSLSYYLTGNEVYSAKASNLLDVWFVQPATLMYPELSYAQVIRGPVQPWKGRSEGIIDTIPMMFVAQMIPLLSKSTSMQQSGILPALNGWFNNYTKWLTESDYGVRESKAGNNHGTWWAAQVAAYNLALGRPDQVKQTIQNYLNTHFSTQIAASGEQTLESKRTRPFHYQCFNLQALMFMAQAGSQVGIDMYSARTAQGATLQTAIDYLTNIVLNGLGATKPGVAKEDPTDLVPHLLVARAVYGDPPDNRYAKALADISASNLKDIQTDTMSLLYPFGFNGVICGSDCKPVSVPVTNGANNVMGISNTWLGVMLISILTLYYSS